MFMNVQREDDRVKGPLGNIERHLLELNETENKYFLRC